MTQNQLKIMMHNLLTELENSKNKKTNGKIIAKAVQLGMKYQEEKIKEGINIVFEELHKKI